MKIDVSIRVAVNLTANEWELYDVPGREEVATKMNDVASAYLSGADLSREFWELWQEFSPRVERWAASHGSCDTEARNAFWDVVDQVQLDLES